MAARAAIANPAANARILLWTLWRSGTHWLAGMLRDLTGLPTTYRATGDDYADETWAQLRRLGPGWILIRHISLDPAALMPEATALDVRVVFLFRDPRDVIASHVNMRKYVEGYRPGLPPFPDMTIDEIVAWELNRLRDRYTRLTPAWALTRHPRLAHVRYEDLWHNAARELARLARFLHVNVSPARIREIVAAHAFRRRTGRARSVECKTAHDRKGVIGDHRDQLTPAQQRRLDEVLAPTLRQLGYAPASTPHDGRTCA